MVTEVPPMVDNKVNAGPDWFFCDGCLAYHAPEYRGEFQSNYKKYCHFALSVIREEEKPVDDIPVLYDSLPPEHSLQTFVTKSPTDSMSETFVTDEKQDIAVMGRPKADLPIDEIMELHRSGTSSRNIVMLLGLKVSYRTVARVIEGQGVLV